MLPGLYIVNDAESPAVPGSQERHISYKVVTVSVAGSAARRADVFQSMGIFSVKLGVKGRLVRSKKRRKSSRSSAASLRFPSER